MVISIIAILAAILFPVFAHAKEAAKKTACLSNVKQLGTATKIYLSDSDDTFYPHRFNCGGTAGNNYAATTICGEYSNGAGGVTAIAPDQAAANSDVNKRAYFVYLLNPYTKNYQIFSDQDNSTAFYPGSKKNVVFQNANGAKAGNNYGGQNSYGHNDFWISPGANTSGGSPNLPNPPSETAIPRIASTVLLVDANYYGAGPDITNETGLRDTSKCTTDGGASNCSAESAYVSGQNTNYIHYWANLGQGNWTQNGQGDLPGSVATYLKLVKGRHNGKLNAQFADGHAKTIDAISLVTNICYWTTDQEGSHPNCN